MGLDQWIIVDTDNDDTSQDAYYRKYYWLRSWIILNTDLPPNANCETIRLEEDTLQLLLDNCKKAFNIINTCKILIAEINYGFKDIPYEPIGDLEEQIETVKNDIETILNIKEPYKVYYKDFW